MQVDRKKAELIMANKLLSFNAVSRASHVSTPTLRKIMRGADVFPYIIGKIANALGVPVEDIINVSRE